MSNKLTGAVSSRGGLSGAANARGPQGAEGKPGKDGISPVVAVEDIDGGHRVTITDKDGETIFDVMDGKGGASSWNDLADKPFGEEQAFEPIVWDGNFDEANTFALGESPYMRISDTILTPDQLNGAKVVCYDDEGKSSYEGREAGIDVYRLYFNGGLDSMHTAILVAIDKDTANAALGITIPSNGIYCLADPELGPYVLSITKSTVKPLDEKYMPTLTSPGGKKFKLTVDDSGTITATEVT